MQAGRIFVMWDETHWASTCNENKSWMKKDSKTGRHFKKDIVGLTMFYAMTSDGRQFFMFL